MCKFMRSIIALCCIWVSACTELSTISSLPGQARHVETASQELIGSLNSRYNNVVNACADDTPAYYCSGVLLRTTQYTASYPFWTHSAPAIALGSVTFSYIRNDVGSDGRDLGSGFIFSDQETAIAEDRAQTVRCIYPFMAGTQSAGRPGYGCGFMPAAKKQDVDHSTCAGLLIPAVTAALWLENFQRFGADIFKQCSLSTLVASQFKASLEAHNGVDAAHTLSRNELLIATWNQDRPEQLPIEAFFYNAATPSGVLNAQSLRHAWYVKTSQKIPIVRIDFSAADKNIFSVNDADQVDGWDVAERLNARYNNTANDCDGHAAFYCNGVLTRVTSYGAGFHSWNPNPNNPVGVAFSYVRRDLKFTHLPYMGSGEQGFIFKEGRSFTQLGVYPLEVLCAYAYDGGTVSRDDNGCGQVQSLFPGTSRPCAEQGITTLAAWRSHFFSQPVANYSRYYHQCSFGADQPAFTLSLLARENPEAELTTNRHNEVMLTKWPQNIPLQLPIDAFFYVYDQSRALGLVGAKFIQNDFYTQTRKVVPVISVAIATGGNNIFSYHPSDQGI